MENGKSRAEQREQEGGEGKGKAGCESANIDFELRESVLACREEQGRTHPCCGGDMDATGSGRWALVVPAAFFTRTTTTTMIMHSLTFLGLYHRPLMRRSSGSLLPFCHMMLTILCCRVLCCMQVYAYHNTHQPMRWSSPPGTAASGAMRFLALFFIRSFEVRI